jgi:3-oxoacyl-[acyl-carrier protein] reductase
LFGAILSIEISHSGRHAVVTGGASGFGFAIAKTFLAAGARVTLWDARAEPLAQACDELSVLGEVNSQLVDVSKHDEVVAVASASGPIDILINNAGISRGSHSIINFPLQDWHDNIAVNLTGVFFCCRAVIPGMVERGWGRVVNVSSMAGKEGNPGMSAYSAAKAGVIALTKSLGKELGTTGVLINAVAPSLFDTPMNKHSREAAPAVFAELLNRIPMGRTGQAEELAALVVWITSDACSFTTGFTFDASGGRAVY